MIKLNLISVKQQQLLKQRATFKIVENYLGLIVAALVIVSVVAIPFFTSLKVLETNIKQRNDVRNVENIKLITEINQFNSKIKSLAEIQNGQYDWSELVMSLSEQVPANIVLVSFNADLDKRTFDLRGYASRRNDLLTFKDNLEKSEKFFNINSPVSDILIREEISFTLSGSFN